MLPKVFSKVAILCALIAATAATPAFTERDILEKRCGAKGCSSKGGNHYCYEVIGCDGACRSDTDTCGGPPACNTHFNNCKRTIDYDIALAGGKLMERDDGTIERSVDMEEYVAAVLDSMRK
ncbi:hypothetical protein IQ07DRAFT_635023 [Pyrenochaeta sp. DS3sAY3a]|nr:hypothetical protein IQ07DRAFT_635023 [Pyrenochaeta sp. DS3sAY3a]